MDATFNILAAYAELFCFSKFTFLHVASHAEELSERAAHHNVRIVNVALIDGVDMDTAVASELAVTRTALANVRQQLASLQESLFWRLSRPVRNSLLWPGDDGRAGVHVFLAAKPCHAERACDYAHIGCNEKAGMV
jgi:hypothetical protein